MNKIKFKINEYDELSHSLIISFASDKTLSQDPANYQSFAYQPLTMWPDINDMEELKKCIGRAGIYLVEQQEKKEQFVEDPTKILSLKSMVGQTVEYDLEELMIQQIDNPIVPDNEIVI